MSESELNQESEPSGEQGYENRLSGIEYPRHILDEDGEPRCGITLDERHQHLFKDCEPEDLEALHSFLEDHGRFGVTDICGNCLRSYRSENDDEELEELIREWNDSVDAESAKVKA